MAKKTLNKDGSIDQISSTLMVGQARWVLVNNVGGAADIHITSSNANVTVEVISSNGSLIESGPVTTDALVFRASPSQYYELIFQNGSGSLGSCQINTHPVHSLLSTGAKRLPAESFEAGIIMASV